MTEHIAILGGGIGSLSAAFSLTQQPDWRSRYRITVYQLGWRLGGKAASGVNFEESGRVEEHGLHVWFGFYQNAFRMMRECYGALDRPATHPMPSAQSAFTPLHHHTFFEEAGGAWMPWSYRFQGDGVLPGAPAVSGIPDSVPTMPGVWGSVGRVLSWVRIITQEHPRLRWLARDGSWLPQDPPWRAPGRGPTTTADGVPLVDALLEGARYAAARPGVPLGALARGAAALRRGLCALLGASDPGTRRLRTMVDLTLTGLVGLLADAVPRAGYRAIDGEDFRAWLSRHGARAETVSAPLVGILYDICFAYEGGDIARPALAAGATLRGTLRLLFGYHGAVLWKMNAGMGDAIIAPLYEVLRQRGVEFRFFHVVDALKLSADGAAIQRIHLTRQARTIGDYEPLVSVRGLRCWPSTPRWSQLVDGEALQASGVDLERSGRGEALCLERGRDFDRVVLGITIGALPGICADLAAARPAWRDMLENIATVRTQALQLWFTEGLAAQGKSWPGGILAAYAPPFSSWSDFSQVIPREEWPEGMAPRYLAYSCGVLPDAPVGPPDDERAVEAVRDCAISWLEENAGPLWPKLQRADGGICWSRLHDLQQRDGPARLDAQYLRANTAPTERYVLALPGTTRYRLAPGDSGFENLVLAGSWTDNHFTLSCIEGTVMSGMMAARAVDGRPRRIIGEGDV